MGKLILAILLFVGVFLGVYILASILIGIFVGLTLMPMGVEMDLKSTNAIILSIVSCSIALVFAALRTRAYLRD